LASSAGAARSAGAAGSAGAAVLFDWGLAGARAIGRPGSALVIVDVLSFSTSVTVATGRGTAVLPCAWGGSGVDAFAASHDAVVAVPRQQATPDRPWSLSPASLLHGPLPARLVLPSANGSAISAAAASGADAAHAAAPQRVLAGCLRNASAVASWLGRHGYGTPNHPVAVVAAGERWPDGELRPALEDLLGAGAVIAALAPQASRSAEATAAQSLWTACRQQASELIRACFSGQELTTAGYHADVGLAVQHDTQDTVPLLTGSAFADAAAR
jgi:2-phosphosulfolactate phosphatase